MNETIKEAWLVEIRIKHHLNVLLWSGRMSDSLGGRDLLGILCDVVDDGKGWDPEKIPKTVEDCKVVPLVHRGKAAIPCDDVLEKAGLTYAQACRLAYLMSLVCIRSKKQDPQVVFDYIDSL